MMKEVIIIYKINHLGKGLIAMVVFVLFNLFIKGIVGNFIDMGYGSAHIFTYIGLVTLCGVIITCTFTIIEKLDEVKKLFNRKAGKEKD